MYLALSLDCTQDRDLIFAQQLGIGHLIATTDTVDAHTLSGLWNRVSVTGMALVAIEGLPLRMTHDAILGGDGQAAAIEAVCETLRALGDVGIRLVGYRWTPPSLCRTAYTPEGRGMAMVGTYDHALAQCMPTEGGERVAQTELWGNLARFLDRVLPVAEEAGVRLACHPDDPPVSSVGGQSRILASVHNLERLLDLGDSPAHGLDLCVAMLATMPGAEPLAAIKRLGGRRRLFMVHLRGLHGAPPRFQETFLDETAGLVPRALLACRAVDFDGPIRAAHPPRMIDDTPWGHKARAHDLGYLRAILQVIEGMTQCTVS